MYASEETSAAHLQLQPLHGEVPALLYGRPAVEADCSGPGRAVVGGEAVQSHAPRLHPHSGRGNPGLVYCRGRGFG